MDLDPNEAISTQQGRHTRRGFVQYVARATFYGILGVFFERNKLAHAPFLVKAAHGVQDTPPSRLTPEEEASGELSPCLLQRLSEKSLKAGNV